MGFPSKQAKALLLRYKNASPSLEIRRQGDLSKAAAKVKDGIVRTSKVLGFMKRAPGPSAIFKRIAKFVEKALKKIDEIYQEVSDKCEAWSGKGDKKGWRYWVYNILDWISLFISITTMVPGLIAAANRQLIIINDIQNVINAVTSAVTGRRRLGGDEGDGPASVYGPSLYHVYRRSLDDSGHLLHPTAAEAVSRWAEVHRDSLLGVSGDEAIHRELEQHRRRLADNDAQVVVPTCFADSVPAVLSAVKAADDVMRKPMDNVILPLVAKVDALLAKFEPLAGFFDFIDPVVNFFSGLVDDLSFLQCPDLGPFNFICDLVSTWPSGSGELLILVLLLSVLVVLLLLLWAHV
jgi:hypothetical protein